MKKKLFHILEIGCSGLIGVVLTIGYQHFLAPSQSFVFIYNGEEIVVTESTYAELIEENEMLNNELFSVQGQLEELQTQIEQQNSAEEISKLIQSATDYWNNSEYLQALTILKNSKSKSSEIVSLYEEYSDVYSTELLVQSDLLISERKYDEAIELLEKGKKLVYDNQIINNKIQDINNNLPQKLSNIKISASRFFTLNKEKTIEDTVGNKYSAGSSFVTYAEGESNYGYGTFYLGQKYSTLSGTIAVSDESENRSDVQLEGWIEIYSKNGEGYEHLWTSPILSRTTSIVKIPEINLSNSEWVEIRYYNNGEYWNLAAGYHSLRVIVSDIMLYSD